MSDLSADIDSHEGQNVEELRLISKLIKTCNCITLLLQLMFFSSFVPTPSGLTSSEFWEACLKNVSRHQRCYTPARLTDNTVRASGPNTGRLEFNHQERQQQGQLVWIQMLEDGDPERAQEHNHRTFLPAQRRRSIRGESVDAVRQWRDQNVVSLEDDEWMLETAVMSLIRTTLESGGDECGRVINEDAGHGIIINCGSFIPRLQLMKETALTLHFNKTLSLTVCDTDGKLQLAYELQTLFSVFFHLF